MLLNRLAFAALLSCMVSSQAMAQNATDAKCDLTPGIIDNYVFAVSWQAGFCALHGSFKECQIHDQSVFQAGHFALHGLWPNQNNCGLDYGFCGVQSQKGFCDYQPVALSPATQEALSVSMPSVASGSCLDRHEWNKHGSCQTRTPDEYFTVAMNLLKQFNDSGLADYFSANIGKDVNLDDFLIQIDSSLGANAHERFKLGCDANHNLVDIYINFPKTVPADASLKDLISQGTPGYSQKNCGPTFKVDKL